MLSELTLHSFSRTFLTVHAVQIISLERTNPSFDCRLTFQVNPELYHCINTDTLFNLNPEFRSSLTHGDFTADRPIQLEVTLHPDLLPLLLEHAKTAEEAATYLMNLSQQQSEAVVPNSSAENQQNTQSPLNPLLNTESWFCLSVKQTQDSGETGYTTLWNYINPATFNQPGTSSDQIAEGITNFIQDWTAANLNAATQDITEELFKGVATLFDGFETWLDKAFSKNKDEDTDGFASDESILATIIAYFTKDDWTFTKLQGQSILQMAYQGENGLWNCYAQAREPQEQFVFYSIYPELVSEDKRLAMAELLTRLNYGLVIGNFEMDFNDGEIRYKTSIGVEGDILTDRVIKRLVYANVTIIDHYLPGIRAVMDGNMSPKDAIAKIENPTQIPEDSSHDESLL